MARTSPRIIDPSEGSAPVSGAGGTPIANMSRALEAAGVGDALVAGLAALGFADAEQLVASASVPGLAEQFRTALGVEDDSFDVLVETARSALSSVRATLTAYPAARDLGLGVVAPSDDMIAAAAATVGAEVAEAAGVLPAAVNLVSFMPPIRNQGGRGTCVSFALTALNEYVLRRRGVVRDLSEQHLYYEIKAIDGRPNMCGTWQVKAIRALSDRGECPESIWPYDPNMPCNNHGPLRAQARPAGLAFRLAPFAVPTRNAAAYKTELARQRPVTLSIPVFDSWYLSAETRRSGRITMRVGGEEQSGGHAVCLVGYQDSPTTPGGGYFIVRNSWGTTNWGYQSPYGPGYGTIPYQYITDCAWEAYSTVVPDVGESEEGGDEHPARAHKKSMVTIQVGSNVTIKVESE